MMDTNETYTTNSLLTKTTEVAQDGLQHNRSYLKESRPTEGREGECWPAFNITRSPSSQKERIPLNNVFPDLGYHFVTASKSLVTQRFLNRSHNSHTDDEQAYKRHFTAYSDSCLCGIYGVWVPRFLSANTENCGMGFECLIFYLRKQPQV